MVAVANVTGIDPTPHIEWANILARMVAHQHRFRRGGQECQDLEGVALLTLVKEAKKFNIPVRSDSNLRDAFRGCVRQSIIRDCRREATRIKGGGSEIIRTGTFHATVFRVGGMEGADVENLFRSRNTPPKYEYECNDDDQPEETPEMEPAPVVPEPTTPPAVAELDSILSDDAGQLAVIEARMNAVREMKRTISPIAAVIAANPELRQLLIRALSAGPVGDTPVKVRKRPGRKPKTPYAS